MPTYVHPFPVAELLDFQDVPQKVGEGGEKWDIKFISWQICSFSEFRNVIDIVWLLLIKANICTLHLIYWRLGTFISSELWVILKCHLMGEMWDRVGEKWDTSYFNHINSA